MNKVCFLFFSILLVSLSFAQEIFINEFQASNEHTISDSFGQFDDWIELHNYGDSAVSLSGLFLSDNYGNLNKWEIPDSITIAANSFKIFWADDQPEQGDNHLGFKLSDDSEEIILSGGDSSSIIDHIEYGQQYSDISFGRHPDPDSIDIWNYFGVATPGEGNSYLVFKDKNSKPLIHTASGYFSQSINVEITSADANSVILYTLNSDVPNSSNSFTYNGPIIINATTVLRAVVKKDGFLNSDPETRSFIFEEAPSLPSFFLVTAEKNMWGPSGILDFRYSGAEKPVHFEFFDRNSLERYQSDAGIKIHSPDGKEQQSFRLYARSEYGNNYFRFKFFEQKEIDKFKRLVLRNAGNDGIQLNLKSHLRDVILHQLYFERNRQNAISAFKTVNVFLNGQYWGLYNLRERQDEYYIEENYPYDGDLDLLERAFGMPGNRNAVSGDWQEYDDLKTFVRDNDISLTENYNYVKQLMDVDNFAEYWIFEVFAGNFDWLSNNIRHWRVRNNQSKWRWIMWDMDHGLGLKYYNYGKPDWNTLEWSTSIDGERTGDGINNVLVRKLLENEAFKNKFINLFADLLNTTFKPANIWRVTDELAGKIEPDVHRSFAKYPSNSYEKWLEAIQSIKNYADLRPEYVKQHIVSKFDLDSSYTLTLGFKNPGSGAINVNTISISEEGWQGDYFTGIPISLTHNSALGYVFDHWDVNSEIITDDTLQITDFANVTAHFEVDTIPEIIVNEINYNSSNDLDSGDWIEINNPKVFDLDISGWVIKDDNDEHVYTFPLNTIIASDSFLVIVNELEGFLQHYPNVTNIVAGLNFGLGNNGDQIRVYNNNNVLIDFVEYADGDPWPSEADGEGYTLELKDLDLDNNLYQNWRSSYRRGGTPGRANDLISSLKNSPILQVDDFKMWQNYPNPFNSETRIEFFVPRHQKLNISVFNNRGQLVEILVDATFDAGNYSIVWNADRVSSGVYFIRQTSRNSVLTIKSLLLK